MIKKTFIVDKPYDTVAIALNKAYGLNNGLGVKPLNVMNIYFDEETMCGDLTPYDIEKAVEDYLDETCEAEEII